MRETRRKTSLLVKTLLSGFRGGDINTETQRQGTFQSRDNSVLRHTPHPGLLLLVTIAAATSRGHPEFCGAVLPADKDPLLVVALSSFVSPPYSLFMSILFCTFIVSYFRVPLLLHPLVIS